MGISREQALDCCNSDDLIGIGMEADAVRQRLHPEGVVSYVLDRTSGYTVDEIDAQLAETEAMGGSGITLRGAAHSVMTLDSVTEMLAGILHRFPSLWVHGFSATEIVGIAACSGMRVREILARFQQAGLQSLSGSDAGILDDSVPTSSTRCSTEDWIEVHRTAHRIGMPTTAAMLFGAGETMQQRVNHLETIRRLQEETGGFIAFLPATVQPQAAGLQNVEEATAVEYLKILAISRIVLDDIANVQADWDTQGLKVLQMALRFGANDAGSAMPSDASIAPDGRTEEDLRRVIRGAGFRPVQRDSMYRTMFLD